MGSRTRVIRDAMRAGVDRGVGRRRGASYARTSVGVDESLFRAIRNSSGRSRGGRATGGGATAAMGGGATAAMGGGGTRDATARADTDGFDARSMGFARANGRADDVDRAIVRTRA